MIEEEERQNYSMTSLSDYDENLILETATKPSLGVSGSDNGLLDHQDDEGDGVDGGVEVVKQAGKEVEEQ